MHDRSPWLPQKGIVSYPTDSRRYRIGNEQNTVLDVRFIFLSPLARLKRIRVP